MKNLTTPKAILFGLFLIAIAIASIPFSSTLVKDVQASSYIQKVQICGKSILSVDSKGRPQLSMNCVGVGNSGTRDYGSLYMTKQN